MADSLAEKGNVCLLNQLLSIVAYNWGYESGPLYGVSGCPLFRGCLSEWKDNRDFQNFPLYRGCPLLWGAIKWGSTVYPSAVQCWSMEQQSGNS